MTDEEKKAWEEIVGWYQLAHTKEYGDARPMGPLTRREKATILAAAAELTRLREDLRKLTGAYEESARRVEHHEEKLSLADTMYEAMTRYRKEQNLRTGIELDRSMANYRDNPCVTLVNTEELKEALEAIEEKADNFWHAAILPVSPSIHAECLKDGMDEIRKIARTALGPMEG